MPIDECIIQIDSLFVDFLNNAKLTEGATSERPTTYGIVSRTTD